MPTLLKTKLYAPLPRPNLVERPRLLARLAACATPGGRLALVSAPAGFGKTTLVAQWLHGLGCPTGWLSLDEGDNLPQRFLAYLVAALQQVVPTAGQTALEILALPKQLDIEALAYGLINDLAVYPGTFVLALDDYHVIHEPVLQRAMELLVENLPPNMRLVILTRQDPALPLSRLRASGQLVELRSSDLRFTPEEAAAFLNEVMGLDLTAADIAALETRTEGWIAGLQMASLALQTQPLTPGGAAASGFIASFSGSHRYILDYLVEEVLNRQPQEIQDFLLQTSPLERFCAPLCAACLAGSAGSAGSILEHLERANLFVVPLDNERRWYRYHHLFADLLRTRLQSAYPERVPRIHAMASYWFEQNGGIKEAFDHAQAAGDSERAAEIIERHYISRWATTDVEFTRLVTQLPLEVLARRPALCLNRAWMQLISGNIDILPLIEMAERQLQPAPGEQGPSPEQRGLLAFASTMRAYLADFHNEAPDLSQLGWEAAGFVPESNVGMRNSVAVVLGTLHYMDGRFPEAARFFLDACERDKAAGTTNAVPIAISRLARLRIAEGQLHEAAQMCRENAAYIADRGSWRYYVGGNLNIALGDVLYEWNDLDEAEKQIRTGLHLNEPWRVPHAIRLGTISLARLLLARQDLEGAASLLDEIRAALERVAVHPDITNDFQACRVHFWLATGDWPALGRWEAEHSLEGIPGLDFRHELTRISLARLWLAQGRAEDAAGLLARLAQAAETGGRRGRLVQILALHAAALAAHPGQALPVLERALRLGGSEGYLRTFLDASPALVPLLVLCRPAAPATVGRLLEAFGLKGKAALPAQQPLTALPEPLSERELEVLRLVAAGLSNQQIASRLVISIRTVKKHIENIHGKLGVTSRTQAIARGRDLGLLN